MRAAAAPLLLFLSTSVAEAATIHVPGDQPTIQAGIDATAPGDTVDVACGTYYEHDIVLRSGITLRSESGQASCSTIDAQGLGRILVGELLDEATRIEGLTFTGGAAGAGGALRLDQSSVNIHGCAFTGNEAVGGGAIYSVDSDVQVKLCEFRSNAAFVAHGGSWGGAIGLAASTCEVHGCVFVNNSAFGPESHGGAIYTVLGNTSISSSVFIRNHAHGGGSDVRGGGAIDVYGGTAELSDCLFVENSTGTGDGQGVLCTGAASISVLRSTFWGHFDQSTVWGTGLVIVAPAVAEVSQSIFAFNEGRGVRAYFDAQISLSCTDIYGNGQGDWVDDIADQLGIDGNFSADPIFCNPDDEDFTLSAESPCLPGNHPDGADCGVIGASGKGCGATAVVRETWAGVKARYRGERSR
jgi:predicted outer membrane repeat protein